MRSLVRISVVVAVAALSFPSPMAAQMQTKAVRGSDELRRSLAEAKPGTTISVLAGDYEGFSFANLAGTAAAPIVVEGASKESMPRFTSGIHLSDIRHVVLRRLLIEGAKENGLNIDDGGSYETPSEHVVLEDIVVRDIGGRGNHDGIKLSGVDDFRIERCAVERWGRGGSAIDMVGCHRGQIVDSTFRDLPEGAASSGVQTKGGSSAITIRRCRFEHSGERAVNIGGSTGRAYFRPKDANYEAKDIVVEGSTFIGSTSPIAFVGVDGAIVRRNTLHLPKKWILRILQETRDEGFVPCRNGVFEDNLVTWRSSDVAIAVNVGPGTDPATFAFARNYWFCLDGAQGSTLQFPTKEREPAGGKDPLYVDAAGGNLELRAGSPAKKHGASSFRSNDERSEPPSKR